MILEKGELTTLANWLTMATGKKHSNPYVCDILAERKFISRKRAKRWEAITGVGADVLLLGPKEKRASELSGAVKQYLKKGNLQQEAA